MWKKQKNYARQFNATYTDLDVFPVLTTILQYFLPECPPSFWDTTGRMAA